MTRRAIRYALLLLLVVVLAACGWFVFENERTAGQERAALNALDVSSRRAAAAVAELRSSLQAHVAVDQDDRFWRPRAAAALESLTQELATLKQLAREGTALNDLDAAAATLEGLTALSERVARQAGSDERKAASRAIFGDGLAALATVAHRVEGAWWAEKAASEGRRAEGRRRSAYAAGAASGVALLVSALLLSTGRRRDTEATAAEAHGDATPLGTTADVATPAPPAAAVTTEAPGLAAPEATASPEAPPGPVSAVPDRRKATELKAMADLCTDFARVVDPQELPALLARAAQLIDAVGLIVWVADADGGQLRPALAHGYGARDLGRLPSIPRDADNATASGYRLAEMQVVRTNGMSPGALVVPLLTPAGCIGVLAAEIRLGRESSESLRALARIVAAQLATLVSVPAAAAGAGSTPAAQGALG